MVKEIEIKKVDISNIKFDDTNPNQLTDEQMDSLKMTMEKFGYLVPVILNKDYTVVDGEHRVRVYQDLGKRKIPAYVIDVDSIDLKILRQLMNKLRGEHDKQKDADEFKSIFDAGKLDEFSQLLAKDKSEFEQILEKKFDIMFEKEETEDIPEPPAEPKAKLGDIYQLGEHRIMCGDSTKDYDILLNNVKPDMCFTDPPFNVDYSGIKQNHRKIENDNMGKNEFNEFLTKSLEIIPTPCYVCCNWKSYSVFESVLNNINKPIKSCIIWDKERLAQNLDKYFKQHEFILYSGKFGGEKTIRGDVWKVKREYSKEHPTSKPIELVSMAIKDSSKENNIVYDPFLGSGSTLIACEQTNRICYGMELDPGYIDVIIQRWENYTGQKAKKL